MKRTLSALALMSSGILLTGCGGSSTSSNDSNSNSDSRINIEIPFKAVAGDQAIKCGEIITGLGTGSSSETGVGTDVKISNFRMFVHDINLITDQGIKIPVTLDANRDGQNADVALLDFRDTADITTDTEGNVNTEICPQTTSDTTGVNPNYNDTVIGSVSIDPAYTISSIQFTLGVPFDLNHKDQAAAEEPLRNPGLASGMTWNWQGGYKFVGFDVMPEGGISLSDGTTGNKWNIHLGSTGCEVNPDPNAYEETEEVPEVTPCGAPNRPTITLPINAVALNDAAIQIDYAKLISDNNLSVDDGVKAGCISFVDDPECAGVFENLGLSWKNSVPQAQTVFTIVDGSND